MYRVGLLALVLSGGACAGPDREASRDATPLKEQPTGKQTGADVAQGGRPAGRDFTVISAEVRRGPLKIVFLSTKGDGVAATSSANEGHVFVTVRVSNSPTLSYKLSEIGILPEGRIEAISNPAQPVLVKVDPSVTSVELATCDWPLVVQERQLGELSFVFRGQRYPLSVRR